MKPPRWYTLEVPSWDLLDVGLLGMVLAALVLVPWGISQMGRKTDRGINGERFRRGRWS